MPDPTPFDPRSAALVSVANELLQQPQTIALIEAVVSESQLETSQLQHHIVEHWLRGIRPTRAIAQKWGLELLTKAGFRHRGYTARTPDPSVISAEALALVPIRVAQRHNFIVAEVGTDATGAKTAVVIAAEPDSPLVREEVAHHLKDYSSVSWSVSTAQSIQAALKSLQDVAAISAEEFAATKVVGRPSIGGEEDDADSAVARYLSSLFNEAVALDVSDIHFMPGPAGLEIRYRRDGIMNHKAAVNHAFGRGLITRLRIICEMKTASNTKEDGGVAITVGERRIDLRVSIVPTVWHIQAVTIRLLATQAKLASLAHLYRPDFKRQYLKAVDRPDGFVLVVGKTGDGKPLSVDALVLMGDGARKRLGDVAPGDEVITDQGRARTVTAVHDQGPLPCLRVETVHGREIVTALDHPFLTPEGWVEAQDLRVGMALANRTERSVAAGEERLDAEFVLAGLMVGEGSCTGYNASWHHRKQRSQHRFLNAAFTADDDLAKTLFLACDELGFGYRKVAQSRTVAQYSLSGGIREWLRQVGLAGHGSKTKRVPEFVYRGTDRQVAMFLGAYLATDGTVKLYQSENGGPLLKGLDYFSSNKALLQDVQHLLLRLGVQSFLSTQNARGGTNFTAGRPYVSWRLFIGHDWDACARLATTVPIPGVKGAVLAQYARPLTRFPERLLGDEIVIIDDAGLVECRCLTVDQDSTFIADDFVVHNSTTLAATLNEIATPEKKACAVEDPVENRMPHIVQVQVNVQAGLTFEEALRAFLRSDPDIIMVGEIRDGQTAKIAVQAAQTGHLVLGTLHIRDAASAPSRLIRDFDIQPVAVADTLSAVLSQRLLRVLCRECRVPTKPSQDDLLEMGWPREDDWMAYLPQAKFHVARAGGCSHCKGMGYLGRQAAPELLVVSDEIQQAIVDGKPAFTLRAMALAEGMEPMWNNALKAAARGETDLAEIQRVLRAPTATPTIPAGGTAPVIPLAQQPGVAPPTGPADAPLPGETEDPPAEEVS